jgi:hypothetical protein
VSSRGVSQQHNVVLEEQVPSDDEVTEAPARGGGSGADVERERGSGQQRDMSGEDEVQAALARRRPQAVNSVNWAGGSVAVGRGRGQGEQVETQEERDHSLALQLQSEFEAEERSQARERETVRERENWHARQQLRQQQQQLSAPRSADRLARDADARRTEEARRVAEAEEARRLEEAEAHEREVRRQQQEQTELEEQLRRVAAGRDNMRSDRQREGEEQRRALELLRKEVTRRTCAFVYLGHVLLGASGGICLCQRRDGCACVMRIRWSLQEALRSREREIERKMKELEDKERVAARQRMQESERNKERERERREGERQGARGPEGPEAQAGDEIPNEFLCPITMDIMKDPVIAMDGMSYDREAISNWLKKSQKSPKTNMLLPSKQLLQNHSLKILIHDWLERHPQYKM